MILTDLLKKNAQTFPDVKALTMRIGYRTVTLTYKQVYDLACCTASFLADQGVEKGDAVLICAPNSPYWIVVFWACLLRGARVVPLNIQSTQEMVEKIVHQTSARIMFHHQFFRMSLPSSLTSFRLEFLPELVGIYSGGTCPEIEVTLDDVVEIMYTSGTTGAPKGVVLTHRNIMSNLKSLPSVIPIKMHEERLVSILPLSHIFEQTIGFLFPYAHAAHIIYPHSHAAIRELLYEYKATKLVVVPEFLHIFMSRIEEKLAESGRLAMFHHMISLSSKIGINRISRFLFHRLHKNFGGNLRIIASGGAPLDPELESVWRAIGMLVLQGYGLTETSPVVTCNTYRENKIGSVGKPLDGVKVQVSKGGEVLVKGENVFQGYYKNDVKTKESFTHNGWFKTGDIGEFDEEGFLFLRGRKKYMILGPGGQNVFPEDVESVLNKIDAVQDSCVIGLERAKGMPQIYAVLLLKESATRDVHDIIAQANAELASYQNISGWTVWHEEDFPRTPTKKIKKDFVKKEILKKEGARGGAREEHEQVSRLVRIVAAVTGIEVHDVHPDSRLIQDLNVDSLMRVEIVARIEEDYGVVIDEVKIGQQTTIEELEKIVKEVPRVKEQKKRKRWPLRGWALFLRFLAQHILFLFARIFIRLDVKGTEYLEGLDLPVILMPNHISYLDPLALAMALPFRIRYRIAFAAAHDMLYQEYKRVAPFGEFLLNAFPFPRKEHENIKPGLESMGRLLDKNFSVILYPEGKLSEDGKLLPFKKGAGLVAVEMGVSVIPVRVLGTDKIVPYGKILPRRRSTVSITFGQPLQFKRSDSYDEVTQRLEQEMKKL